MLDLLKLKLILPSSWEFYLLNLLPANFLGEAYNIWLKNDRWNRFYSTIWELLLLTELKVENIVSKIEW